ncbi:demethoxyubiquinone hydroxylase family protein [Fuchsiella alkaliacetigena]|uniref:demethoxyubiquinone hydroxylase family protein n=1 Tax=Fuchsiella alkaliacetigena TaxID=957042 RepID=UPI00200AE8F1|nr:ferritin-like domain-containing protein [Fuchsiella alkaliacetigena]MCK8824862.1 ferritin-like domain-containing protein [Fuchsiella alkaliacetigena]
MQRKKLINKLNLFYSLELNQVDLYTAQSQKVKDSYTSQAFERIAYIEQQHVDNIAEKIKELGARPSKLGDVISPIVGKLAGKVLSLSGLENILKVNILLEQKAMEDYQKLIESLNKDNQQQEELLKILKFNHIDEDLHTAWFLKRLAQLRSN